MTCYMRWLIVISAVLVFSAFNACSHLKESPVNGDSLKEAVTRVWEAKVQRDWGTVYSLTVDEYKKKKTRDDFIRRCNIIVKEFDIKEIRVVEPDKKARVEVEYKVQTQAFLMDMISKEEWLRENGSWHLNLLPTLEHPIFKK